ncbi:MAG: hypothetical protein Q8R28_07980 [Dehalococcoidia bacterium]|nr:hypothetical protein [Dehalococcoidia bacterium]
MGLIWNVAQQNDLIRAYPKSETAEVVGQERALAELVEVEVAEMINKLDRQFDQGQFDYVARMVADNLPNIIDVVRQVKQETTVAFAGASAKGNALDINLARATDFTRIGGATTPLDWLLNHSATGAADWIGSSANEEENSLNEAFIFMGIVDPIEVPKIDAIQFYRFGDALGPTQAITIRNRRSFGDNHTPAMQFPRAIAMLTEAQFNVRLNVAETGYDRLEPVALHVARRADITSL